MTPAPLYLLDTNICLHIPRWRPLPVLARFEALKPGQAVISTVTWGQLWSLAVNGRQPDSVFQSLKEFAGLVPVMPLPPASKGLYVRIRTDLAGCGLTISPHNLWIAAHALAAGLTLVTCDRREFEPVAGLKVESWV